MNPPMDIGPVIVWAAAITTLLSLATTIWTMLSAPSRKNDARLSQLEGTLEQGERATSERIATVERGLQRVAEMWFGHVAVQPGGPQGCGSYRGIPVLCLPGNPVSTWVSCEIFVRPALADVWGCCGASQWFTAVLAEPVRQLPGRVQLRRGVLEAGPAAGPALEPVVRCEGGPSSHLLMSAARATVLLRIPEGTGPLPSGTRVAVLPVTGGTAQQTGARP